jgi:hypothetical protein
VRGAQRSILKAFALWLSQRNRIKPTEIDTLVDAFMDYWKQVN